MALRGMLPHSLTSTRTGESGVGDGEAIFMARGERIEIGEGSVNTNQHKKVWREDASERKERGVFGGRANRCAGETQTARSELFYR